jgi:signal transduction histidine kinase
MKKDSTTFFGKLFGIRAELLRGDSLFAILIFVIVSAFLVNLAVSVWHNIRLQRDITKTAAIENIQSISHVLSMTSEALLAADELSALRRIISETRLENNLIQCQIVLPTGKIIADADPDHINQLALPQTWEGIEADPTEHLVDNEIRLGIPLTVGGRGPASLLISAGIPKVYGMGNITQTAQMALACLALATMLLVHRHTRFRLKAIGAIHEALMAVRLGESSMQSLELNPNLGYEAVAWNQILGQRQGQQIRTAIELVQESLHDNSGENDTFITICDSLPLGLILVNRELTVEYCNNGACTLLKTTPEDLNNARLTDHISNPMLIDPLDSAIKHPSQKRINVEIQPNPSESTIIRFTVCPIQTEGEGDRVVLTIEDITGQKVSEKARNEFLSTATHELRTPLTNVQLYTEKALGNCQEDPTGTARSLSVISRESKRLETIVSEILSISELEAGCLSIKQDDVRLKEIMQQLKTEYTPQAKEKRLKLSFDLAPKIPVIHADQGKLCVVLHNLIGNAIKYTPRQGQVQVKLEVIDDAISIQVSDTGIGIAESDINHIFNKFYRAKDRRLAKITGSGLGLSIARELARLHGGDITVESCLNEGTTSTFTIPVSQEDAVA